MRRLALYGLLAAPLVGQVLDATQKKAIDDAFARYDRSGDGKVVRDEFPGSDAQFRAIDADGNGQITRDEFAASAAGKLLLAALEATKKEPRPRVEFDALAARRLRALTRFDRNHDGTVTRAEWRGTDLAFRTLDADANGVLDSRDRKLAEVEDRGQVLSLRAFKQPLPPAETLIAKFDRDKDGALGRAELAGSDIAPLFALVDTNGDGSLDPNELQRLVGAVTLAVLRRNAGTRADVQHLPEIPFATWDKDKDGRLANSEFELRNLFVAIDADRDGYVTKEEIERYRRSLEEADFLGRFDLNGDGRVTFAEFGGPLEVFRRADRNGDGTVSKQDL